ncbi:unnamed protein product [Ambrosiozyma monospora]|uniref:Unnamed protein product n=1 Tax=Ambrosiozyma monospora TaxID=43982 RepID=A0ACB5TAX6_AMBMO|nr:unnamed protein product [Ambrosiozyma monospora]
MLPPAKPSPVLIPEDDRFKLDVPLEIDLAEILRKLREPQLHELQPSALNLIHETYMELIDSKDKTKVYQFSISQFLQFLSIYLPFLHLKISSPTLCYMLCADRQCKTTFSISLDTVKGLFHLKHTRTPRHQHTSTAIVELAKLEYTKWMNSNETLEQMESHAEPQAKSHSESYAKPNIRKTYLPVNIPEDSRFTLSKISADSSNLLPQLKEKQPEPKPKALKSIHETYSNVIDLKDTIHLFTISQFLQFLAVYIPFLRVRKGYGNKGYLVCVPRLKCKASLTWMLDVDHKMFHLTYTDVPDCTHTHSSAEIVAMAKKKLTEQPDASDSKNQYLAIDIPENAKFTASLNVINRWSKFLRFIRNCQSDELEPDALDLIHETIAMFIVLVDSDAEEECL